MGYEAFETATRRGNASQGSPASALARYRPQIAVSVLVVIVLIGGAMYTSRVSERAPQVVYSASLEEVETGARDSLQVNLNTADVEELDELPEVGPVTAERIVEYRQVNGAFRSVDELASIQKYKNWELHFRASLARDRNQVLELTCAY
jgi:competence protein ComEA